MHHPARALVVIGLVITAVGVSCLLAPHIPGLGRLPGDIVVEGKGVRFYFPVVTCIVLRLLLTGVLWLIRLFQR